MAPPFAPRAVLFDLDGTLADTRADIALALDAAREAEGLPPVADPARVRAWIGHGARRLVARSLGGLADDAPEVARVLAAFRRLYPAISGRHSCLYPGVAAWATALRAGGKRLGVTTNKPRAATDAFLDAVGARHLFDVVRTPDDVGDRTKPDPAMLLDAAAALGVPPGACVVLGDGDADVHGARAAGMPVIAVYAAALTC
mgnify:CR=1 FL=1